MPCAPATAGIAVQAVAAAPERGAAAVRGRSYVGVAPVLHRPAYRLVTVCVVPELFVHVTVLPTLMVWVPFENDDVPVIPAATGGLPPEATTVMVPVMLV